MMDSVDSTDSTITTKTENLEKSALDTDIDRSILVENLLTNMEHLEQFVKSVVNYSTKANNSYSINYAPENLVGKYSRYPKYGDSPETYTLRHYGDWWRNSLAAQQPYNYRDIDPYDPEDFVTVCFENAVLPRQIFIYETFNPGAIVRIWGRHTDVKKWKVLWEGEPQICKDEARKFAPPIRKLNSLINEVRLEFNHSRLKYCTSIDAILLSGLQPLRKLQKKLLLKELQEWVPGASSKKKDNSCMGNSEQDSLFFKLPYEVIVNIFQYLDLRSLGSCALVNKRWYNATYDPSLYQNISIKRYWNKFTRQTIPHLRIRCRTIKKLDLTWCLMEDYKTDGRDDELLVFFLESCRYLTHLALNNCDFVDHNLLMVISKACRELQELRIRSAICTHYDCLHSFTKLVTIDLCNTTIDDDCLVAILRTNPKLQNINLDLCENLIDLDFVISIASVYTRDLRTWSSNKIRSLTPIGAGLFGSFPQLRELDLGWCLMLNYPNSCLEHIAEGCKELRRLNIAEWRGVNDTLLLPVVNNCKNLRELDLMGITGISYEFTQLMIALLPNLHLLDISYCSSIRNDKISFLRTNFRHVTIQRSCEFG